MTRSAYAPFDVDRFLDELLRTVDGSTSWTPACNVYEDEHGFWVQAAIPGMDRKDIEIVMENGVLTLKGERKADDSDSNRTYFAHEVEAGKFSRSFRLPSNVDPSKVSASYKDGMLTISLPKRDEAKPRRILIE